MADSITRDPTDFHYQFGVYRLYPRSQILTKDGVRVALTAKATDVLLALVEKHGETISKDELRAAVWGSSPAVEENNLNQCVSAIRKALGERPGENRYIVTVTGAGYRFVAPVVECARESSAESHPAPGDSSAGQVVKPERWRHFGWRAAAPALACVFLLGYRHWHAQPGRAGTTARRSIAVLGFKDITGSGDWLSTALSEMLTMDLAESGQVRAIPVDHVAEIKRDLKLGNSDGFPSTSLHRIRARAGADWVIAGAYTALGSADKGEIRLDVRVQDTHSGETIAAVSETGTQKNLFDLADRAAIRLERNLGLPQNFTGAAAAAALPTGPGAMRLYAEGLDRLRESNPVVAREVLQRAIEADPSNPFPYAALASAWFDLGYEGKAAEAAERAYRLSSHLNAIERLRMQGRLNFYAHRWDEAARIYRKLQQWEPDEMNDALLLATAESRAGKAQQALATLEELRKLPAPLGNDPRIDFAEAESSADLEDFQRACEYAQAAKRKALANGARLLYARAMILESGILLILRRPDMAGSRDQAWRVCRELGDKVCEVQALRVLAHQTLWSSPARAKEMYEQGLRISQEMGWKTEEVNWLNGLGAASQALGDFGSAEASYSKAAAIAREIGRLPSAYRMGLANVYAAEGKLRQAETLHRSVVARVRAIGDLPEELGDALANLANVLRLEGEAAAAHQLAEEAVRTLRARNLPETGQALAILGDCSLDAGDVNSARRDYEQARALGVGPRAELGLAQALLAARDLVAAQGKAAEAVQRFHALGDPNSEALARAVLVRVLLTRGNVGAALAAANEEPEHHIGDPYARLKLGIARARAESAARHSADALKRLSALTVEAERLGYAGLALEARLAQSETLGRAG